jgi:hypothetical protein
MHALVWRQSGGEPWSFTVPGEREPRVYRKLRDAVHEANALHTDRPIRVGLAGLVTNASAVTETTFLPCPNIAAAAHQINQFTARCEANSQSDPDHTFCAVAAYHGSWKRPDTAFARAVRATFSNNAAPNFDMPKEAGIKIWDALLDTPSAAQTRPPSRSEHPSEDNEHAWSSALFPAKPERSNHAASPSSIHSPPAENPQPQRKQNVQSSGKNAMSNSLFGTRLSSREP